MEKTDTTRRGFLRQMAMLGLTAVVGALGEAPAFAGRGPNWQTLTADQMAGMIGDRFRLRLDDGTPVELRLAEVVRVDSGPALPGHLLRRDGMVAVFEGERVEELVAQGHRPWPVTHDRLGSCDLFLGTVPRRGGGYTVEAGFN